MILEKVVVGEFQVNCYILAQNNEAIIIDPGAEPKKIKRILDKLNLAPFLIINTHGHIDHISADEAFGVPIYIHKDEVNFLRDPELNLSDFLGERFSLSANAEIFCVEDNQEIKLNNLKLKVIHTPGHTPGGISLWLRSPRQDILFTGDTLFAGSIGRTDFLGADIKKLLESIRKKIFVLNENIKILPGHGPESTIGREKQENPYLRDG